MSAYNFRWLRCAVLAVAGGGAIALTAPLASADDTALIMGGSGMPHPPAVYVNDVNDLYVHCDPPACTPQALFTPEQFFPIAGGPHALTYDASVAQGVTDLNEAIKQQLAAGDNVAVLGYSQSSTVASLEMQNILNGSAGIDAAPDQLSFVLLGDPNNPNGGLMERFDLPDGSSPSFPSLGITYDGATPITDYPTDIYTAEYDMVGDFPRYPINLLADANALLGFFFVHTQYPNLTNVGDAVEVPTSAGYDGDTTYYMIPTEDLPLLDPLRSIPVVGPLLSDLIQPDLRVLVNLGYGDPNYGWVNEDANVATPVGLFPSLSDLEKVPGLLVTGTEQGIQNAINDLQNPSQLFSLADNPLLNLLQTPYFAALASSGLSIPPPTDTLAGIVNALNDAGSSAYSTVQTTVDFVNALVTTLPAYDATIFTNELGQGDLLDAIGLPISADIGIISTAGLNEVTALGEGSAIALLDLISPFVDVASLIP